MRRWTSLGCVLALAGLGMWGCDNNTMTDAGVTPGTDGGGGGSDSGPPPATPAVGFGTSLASLTPADYSCRGMVAAPDDSGSSVSFTAAVTDFQNSMPVGDIVVDFFPDNVVTDGCTGSCVEVTSDSMGNATVMDNEGSWYAYRLVAGTGTQAGAPREYIEVVQFNEEAPGAGSSATLNAVQAATRNTIVTLLGVMQEDGTATITGRLADCGGEAIANATIRAFGDSGEITLASTGRTGPHQFYFGDTDLPAVMQRQTNFNGLYGATNLPIPASGTIRIELWGSLTEGGASEMLGCENVPVTAGGIVILNVGPTRSDGPSTCSG